MSGLSLGSADTLLTQRAADYLAAGPADPQALISHVCQIPGTPSGVAEHMAAALFAGHQRFVRDMQGRWMLRDARPNVILSAQREGLLAASAVASVEGVLRSAQDEALANIPFAVVDVETTGSRAGGSDR